MTTADLRLFALDATRALGERIADGVGVHLAEHEERDFEDGEHKVRPLDGVQGCDAFAIQSLHGGPAGSVNDKLVRLLFFLGALKDAGAARTTAVVPYLAYARKDRKTKLQDPVSTRYLAAMFESVGVDRVMTIDVHNLAAYQNAHRIHTVHLEARVLFAEWCARQDLGELVVASPDVGGVKRADAFQETLEGRLGREVGTAFMEKQRSEGVVSGDTLVGDVDDRTVLIIDDLISSGTTLARCARACRDKGARDVYALATHGAFTAAADDKLTDEALAKILVTDTVASSQMGDALRDKVEIVSCADLFAEAIRRLHQGAAVEELRERWAR
jgi:ribose-phosphate pyrophosphokinase